MAEHETGRPEIPYAAIIAILSLLVAAGQLVVQQTSRDDVFVADRYGRIIEVCAEIVTASERLEETVYEASVHALSQAHDEMEAALTALDRIVADLQTRAVVLQLLDGALAGRVEARLAELEAHAAGTAAPEVAVRGARGLSRAIQAVAAGAKGRLRDAAYPAATSPLDAADPGRVADEAGRALAGIRTALLTGCRDVVER